MGTFIAVGQGVLLVLGGLVVVLKVIAPLTETKVDDKLGAVFSKAADLLRKVVG